MPEQRVSVAFTFRLAPSTRAVKGPDGIGNGGFGPVLVILATSSI